jgi:hypothetical protein
MSKSSKPKSAKTAPPSKPQTGKTQPGKSTTSKGESYHEGKHEHGGHGSHTEVGVGVNIDLSGIGQRRAEPDPFAVSAGPQPVTARTDEKPKKPTKPREVAKTDPFTSVQLTGERAKEENSPPGPINVSDGDRPIAPPPGNQNGNVPPTGAQTRNSTNPPSGNDSLDDGLPPPPLTEKDCARQRNRLLALLAAYDKEFDRLSTANAELFGLGQEAWEANNKINEGYEDQSLLLISQGRDEWEHIEKEWGPAQQRYDAEFDAATKAHGNLIVQRAAFQRMCPGVAPPEIPDVPKRSHYQLPEPYER